MSYRAVRWISYMLALVMLLSAFFSASALAVDVDPILQDLADQGEQIAVIVILENDLSVLENVGDIEDRVGVLGLDAAAEDLLVTGEIIDNQKEMVDAQQTKVLDNLDIAEQDEELDREDIKISHQYETINGFSAMVTPRGLEKLKRDPNVVRIQRDRKVQIAMDVSVPKVNADDIWNISINNTWLNGTGETVCVIDTGVNAAHLDLVGKVIAEYCYCDDEEVDTNGVGCCPNGNITDTDSEDDHSHGTHVIGTVVSNNLTYRGVAPGASIVSIKGLDSAGSGYFSDIAASIDWCVNNATKYNISVITMSIGDQTQNNDAAGQCDGYLTANAIDSAVAAGIFVAVASGNEAYSNGISYPACASNATSVGGTDDSDNVASFSNTDEILDLMAPGAGIISTGYTGGTLSKSGTSMATPHVAGAAVLIQQYARLHLGGALNPHAVEDVLKDYGVNVTDADNGLTFPRINIYASLVSLDNTSPTLGFIDPTPADGSVNTETFMWVNISADETLDSAWVEIGGTNVTLNGTSSYQAGLDSWINFTIYANDSAGYVSPGLLRTAFFNNTAPNITSYYPTDQDLSISEPGNQSFNVSYTDIEESSDSQAITVIWKRNGTQVGNSTSYTFTGNYTVAGVYNISVVVSDTDLEARFEWTLEVNNTNRYPSAQNVQMLPASATSADNLTCSYTYTDLDVDDTDQSRIRWFLNNAVNNTYENLTVLNAGNVSKNQNWSCEISPYDGYQFGTLVNSTNVTVVNSAPSISAPVSVSVNEYNAANITVNVTDADGDSYTVAMNDSSFTQIATGMFIWNTTGTDAGSYSLLVNATDGTATSTATIALTVVDQRDLDGDGSPDVDDADDDGDGINDTIDFIVGNMSHINSSWIIGVEINGSTNLSRALSGMVAVNFTYSNDPLIELNFNLSNTHKLDLTNVTIQKQTGGNPGSLIIRGIPESGIQGTKTVYVDDVSAYTAVCVKDADVGAASEIDENCDGSSETVVYCDGSSYSGYRCTDLGDLYQVTNLNHSGLVEMCVDGDNDGYTATGCGGTDCNDGSSIINPGRTEICENSIDEDCSGSDATCDSSGSGGGGGGGSGGSATPTTLLAKESFFYDLLPAATPKSISISNDQIPVTKVSFTPTTDASSITVSIESVTADAVPSVPEDAYMFVKITNDVIDAEIEGAEIEFEVTSAWLGDYEIDSVKLHRHTGSWEELPTSRIGSTTTGFKYRAETPGFSYFAITAEPAVIAVPEPEPVVEPEVEELVPVRETRAVVEESPEGFIIDGEPMEKEVTAAVIADDGPKDMDIQSYIPYLLVLVFTIITIYFMVQFKSELSIQFSRGGKSFKSVRSDVGKKLRSSIPKMPKLPKIDIKKKLNQKKKAVADFFKKEEEAVKTGLVREVRAIKKRVRDSKDNIRKAKEARKRQQRLEMKQAEDRYSLDDLVDDAPKPNK